MDPEHSGHPLIRPRQKVAHQRESQRSKEQAICLARTEANISIRDYEKLKRQTNLPFAAGSFREASRCVWVRREYL